MNNSYSKALTEVNSILEYSSQDVIAKIPFKFREFILNNMDKNYIFNVQLGKSLEEQNLKKETKYILSLIYRDFLTTKEQREFLIKNELKTKKEIEEKYRAENIFKKKDIGEDNNLSSSIQNSNTALVEYKKIKWYQKIFDKVRKILKI